MNEKKQNPLGIIAVFASLAEVAGTIVLGSVSQELQGIFIWYVMLFPVLLVLLFFVILYKKPLNFYSPGYYKNEDNFINAMVNNQKKILQIVDDVVNDEGVSESMKVKIKSEIQKVGEDLNEININRHSTQNELSIRIGKDVIEANTVKSFYEKIFYYLIENDIDFQKKVPYKTGPKRYLINTEDKHINGEPFYSPIELGDYFMETNKSKIGAKSDVRKFLRDLGLKIK